MILLKIKLIRVSMKKFITICLIIILSSLNIQAQENSINFNTILAEGFSNNYNIKIKLLSVEKANYTLLKTKGNLNPFLNSNLTYGSGVNPSFDNDGTKVLQTEFIVPTKFGIDFYSGYRLERTIEIDPTSPFNSTGAFTGVKIPLLNGFGKASPLNTGILLSETNKRAVDMELSNEILSYFTQLLINYLTLKQHVEEINISKDILKQTIKYKNEINDLIEKDIIPLPEESRANSLYIQKLQKLNLAQMQATSTFFNTKILIGKDNFDKIEALPTLTDYIPNPTRNEIFSFVENTIPVVDSLIRMTPQYKSIELRVFEEELVLKQAKNQTQNPLDLNIRLSSFGSDQNNNYNFDHIFNGSPGTSLLVTLTHNLPIKNERRRGAYLEQKVAFDISKTSLSQYLYENSINTKLKLDLLRQRMELYDETLTLTDLMRKNYQDEFDKYKLGSATQTDVIIVLEDYFEALKSLNNLKYDVWMSFIEIKFLLGDLPKTENELSNFFLTGLSFN
jgi:outer membrane protein TolC